MIISVYVIHWELGNNNPTKIIKNLYWGLKPGSDYFKKEVRRGSYRKHVLSIIATTNGQNTHTNEPTRSDLLIAVVVKKLINDGAR